MLFWVKVWTHCYGQWNGRVHSVCMCLGQIMLNDFAQQGSHWTLPPAATRTAAAPTSCHPGSLFQTLWCIALVLLLQSVWERAIERKIHFELITLEFTSPRPQTCDTASHFTSLSCFLVFKMRLIMSLGIQSPCFQECCVGICELLLHPVFKSIFLCMLRLTHLLGLHTNNKL